MKQVGDQCGVVDDAQDVLLTEKVGIEETTVGKRLEGHKRGAHKLQHTEWNKRERERMR